MFVVCLLGMEVCGGGFRDCDVGCVCRIGFVRC